MSRSFVVVPAGRCAVQSLPRLPALLSSPSLSGPGLVPLERALELLLSVSSPSSSPPPPSPPSSPLRSRNCALAEAVVASPPAVAVRRAHSSCGRPLRRSALDPSVMAEMMMMVMEEEEEEEGGFGAAAVPAAAAPPAPLPSTAAKATGGSLVLSVPAPTPGPTAKGSSGTGSGKKKSNSSSRKRQPPETPAAAAALDGEEEDASGFLWTCDFCGVDCSASGVSLGLELDLRLLPLLPIGGNGGKEQRITTAVSARAEGAAAASLLGCVPSEFVAWTPKVRASRAAALEGSRVRLALVPSSKEENVVDIAGVMLLYDDDEEEESGSEDDE